MIDPTNIYNPERGAISQEKGEFPTKTKYDNGKETKYFQLFSQNLPLSMIESTPTFFSARNLQVSLLPQILMLLHPEIIFSNKISAKEDVLRDRSLIHYQGRVQISRTSHDFQWKIEVLPQGTPIKSWNFSSTNLKSIKIFPGKERGVLIVLHDVSKVQRTETVVFIIEQKDEAEVYKEFLNTLHPSILNTSRISVEDQLISYHNDDRQYNNQDPTLETMNAENSENFLWKRNPQPLFFEHSESTIIPIPKSISIADQDSSINSELKKLTDSFDVISTKKPPKVTKALSHENPINAAPYIKQKSKEIGMAKKLPNSHFLERLKIVLVRGIVAKRIDNIFPISLSNFFFSADLKFFAFTGKKTLIPSSKILGVEFTEKKAGRRRMLNCFDNKKPPRYYIIAIILLEGVLLLKSLKTKASTDFVEALDVFLRFRDHFLN